MLAPNPLPVSCLERILHRSDLALDLLYRAFSPSSGLMITDRAFFEDKLYLELSSHGLFEGEYTRFVIALEDDPSVSKRFHEFTEAAHSIRLHTLRRHHFSDTHARPAVFPDRNRHALLLADLLIVRHVHVVDAHRGDAAIDFTECVRKTHRLPFYAVRAP